MMGSDWRESARSGEAVALFDLDGTITRGDTYVAFLLAALASHPWRLAGCPGLAVAAARFRLGRLGNDGLKAQFLRTVLGGLGKEDVDSMAARFSVRCRGKMAKPAALGRIGWHRARGHRLVLVTAGLDIYAVPLGLALGFDDVVATRAGWDGGRLTGSLAGPNLRGGRKLDALEAAGLLPVSPHAESYAYCDHHSDLPLLCCARHRVAVDPTPRLAKLASLHGIRIERWRR
jgi:phosphatidylglycerophosphatase C